MSNSSHFSGHSFPVSSYTCFQLASFSRAAIRTNAFTQAKWSGVVITRWLPKVNTIAFATEGLMRE
jgi:hypothetical protein